MERIWRTFEEIDVNSNGLISLPEFKKWGATRQEAVQGYLRFRGDGTWGLTFGPASALRLKAQDQRSSCREHQQRVHPDEGRSLPKCWPSCPPALRPSTALPASQPAVRCSCCSLPTPPCPRMPGRRYVKQQLPHAAHMSNSLFRALDKVRRAACAGWPYLPQGGPTSRRVREGTLNHAQGWANRLFSAV